jgi:hypothetical protein
LISSVRPCFQEPKKNVKKIALAVLAASSFVFISQISFLVAVGFSVAAATFSFKYFRSKQNIFHEKQPVESVAKQTKTPNSETSNPKSPTEGISDESLEEHSGGESQSVEPSMLVPTEEEQIREACANNFEKLSLASKEITLKILSEKPELFRDVSAELKNDIEVLEFVFTKYPSAVKHAGGGAVEALITKDPTAFILASKDHQNDSKIASIVYKKDSFFLRFAGKKAVLDIIYNQNLKAPKFEDIPNVLKKDSEVLDAMDTRSIQALFS